jgi:hypothetical protein
MKKIELTRGYFAIVDDEDFEKINQYDWHVISSGEHTHYAVRQSLYKRGHKRRKIYMHREIVGNTEGVVDHINHNGLDNRKCNLRPCTQSQNMQNQRSTRGSSKFKGVAWISDRSYWHSTIWVKSKNYHLGGFHSESLAAEAYDYAATLFFGDFACLNFPLAKAKYLFILDRVIADNLERGLLTP